LSGRHRLLLSARDVGAGQAIVELGAAAAGDRRFEVSCVLQAPAADRYRGGSHDCVQFAAPIVSSLTDGDAAALLAAARAILAKHRPDALVVGLSGPGAGLDEALLYIASEDLPTFAVQDFWGDANRTFGTLPRHFLCIDEVAVGLTGERWSATATAVGSLKHVGYAGVDVDMMRSQGRTRFAVGNETWFLAIAGQPLWDEPAYGAAIADVLRIAAGFERERTRLVYRPHPKEGSMCRERVTALASQCGLAIDFDDERNQEPLLAAADLLITPFSTCGYDHAQLSRQANGPLGTVLYVLSEPRLAELYRRWTGLLSLPCADMGLGSVAWDREALASAMRHALAPEARDDYWRKAQAELPDPSLAAARALDVIDDWLARSERGK